jgi:predicted membrane chloride channel (bestrophin family)
MQPLDKSQVPSGFLEEYGCPILPMATFNGTLTDSNRVVLILYAFASLELIAEEIENPFGTDANDLPIDSICINIKKHVNEIFN